MGYPEIWITDETPPRGMIVKGISAIDWDCLVAYYEGEDEPLWIIEHNGYVCDRRRPRDAPAVHAHISALTNGGNEDE